jgi:putative heme iron utilization protein
MAEKTADLAAAARSFFLQNRTAFLSTLSSAYAGAPFGSIIPYDITASGDFIIYVSLIAEHYKNLCSDPRGSILAANYFAYDDPQAFGRATALCRFMPISDSERESIQRSYTEKFPDSVRYEIAHNFVFLKGVPERIRWTG